MSAEPSLCLYALKNLSRSCSFVIQIDIIEKSLALLSFQEGGPQAHQAEIVQLSSNDSRIEASLTRAIQWRF